MEVVELVRSGPQYHHSAKTLGLTVRMVFSNLNLFPPPNRIRMPIFNQATQLPIPITTYSTTIARSLHYALKFGSQEGTQPNNLAIINSLSC